MRKFYLFILLCTLFFSPAMSQVSLTGGTYTQDFNTLSNTAGSTTNSLSIPGWLMTESGGGARDNEQYAVDPGSSNTGDTYSYGSAAATDRALGGLRSGTLIPLYGAFFTNNTGSTITELNIAYTGEQWRLGTITRTDQINFEYSLNATSLTTGTWNGVAALNFVTPNTATVGAKDGNAAGNRTAVSSTITGLNIPAGSTFYIRWTDTDATGADDGLSVDDFSITPNTGVSTPVLSINDITQSEGNSGTTNFLFTVSLSSPAGAGGVTFDISTADNTATLANNDYILNALTAQTIPAGSSTYAFTVQVNGDASVEPNETFFVNVTNITGATAGDAQGQGTIQNDDVVLTPIHDIQGSGNSSPINGAVVTTSGIVTGRRSNGFFMQEPDASQDADPLTSEGIFVFTSGAPPAAATVGNLVQVTGTVVEFIPGGDPNSPPQTELTGPTIIQLSTGNPLPTAVTLTAADTDPAGSISQLEKFESMRVFAPSITVVAPTQGSITETSATSTSNGFFYGVITGIPRPFREPGVQQPDPLPSGAPATVTRWDANPEVLGVGSSFIGAPALDVCTGAVLSNVTGPLDYRNRAYIIDIDPATSPVISNNSLTFTAVPAPTADEITVASFNVQRFYDDINDAGGDVVLTTTAYNNRLNKVSLGVRNVLRYPDIIGMVEVENLAALSAIANKINSDATSAGDPNPGYTPFLVEGNDVGLIDVGFLVKSRITVNSVTQYGLTDTYINPNNGLPETLNDRPPLVLDASYIPACGATTNLKVIVNHLRSLNLVNDPVEGPRVRAKRAAQAEFLANLIQGFQTADPAVNIVSVGDYNAFEFNDGYVDMIGTIKGVPTPAANVTLASPDLVNPDLTSLVDTHTPSQKYSYNFSGNAQTLDHILVNANLLSRVTRFAYARLDADFPEVFRNDPNRPERISDHDAPVVYLSAPAVSIVINSVTVIQPTCALATGTITVNATGSGTLEYSADNGASWQSSGTFSGLAPGNYNVQVRLQASPSCIVTYSGNPVVLTPYPLTNLPVTEGFESTTFPPNGYSVINPDNGITWARTTLAAKTGVASMRINLYNYSTRGEKDLFVTPKLNTNAVSVLRVNFDVAYARYSSVDLDSLEVVYSTDCGITWLPTGYAKTQLQLATNGGSVITGSFTPTASQWRNETVDISICSGVPSLQVGFRSTNQFGNNIYIDNLIITGEVDNLPPVITCPAPVTVSCAADAPAPNTGLVTATDNCGNPAITHISDVISAQTCANRYTITRTYRATDGAGNFSECTQTITVNDQTPPTITCPAPVTVSCAANVPAPNIALVTATDNCAGVVTITHISDVISNQTCANRYTVTRTYRATDVCGNFSECTQIITVNDQTPPTITCPAPVTVSCAANVPAPNIALVTATDNCAGVVTITHISDVISNQTCANRYTITRTYRATDVCGNFAQCTQIITVNDQTPPTITCPAPVTVSCASAVPAPNIALVTATDNCAGVVTITHISDVITNQTCPNRFTLTRTYRATDVCGNFSECTQVITVNDQTAPVITCPANITVTTPVGSCTAVVNFTVTATDNCGAVTVVSSPASGTAFPIGTTLVTSTATDACGNVSTCTFSVTVLDAQLPTITAQPVNQTVCVGQNATFSVTAVTAPSAGGPIAYQWQQWNGSAWVNVAGATASSFTVSNVTLNMNTNTFRVVLTGLCTVVTSNAATLRVNPLPTLSLTATPLSALLPNQVTSIHATVNPAGGSFVWALNGSIIPGATGSTLGPINVNGIGTYTAVYTDPNGCTSATASVNITAMASSQLWVYPNPNTGTFNVRFYNQTGEQVTLKVFNPLGQVIYTQSLPLGIAYSNIVVNLGNVPAGVYIVKIMNGTGAELAAKRVVVNHP